ncbi:hypothetical protein N7456_004028 [Penicillium angulare]|uniref:Zn(2)-C6 fungal-type domain-containing protein n=1 Tax=Penicillium angulare TaxID=116970 RepID=A0A9W9KJ76_9EURO|nr:hypothetical protein N7456_004028 [Penicillium angulare]
MHAFWRFLLCCAAGRWHRLDEPDDAKTNESFKCDEKRPSCVNCLNHDIACSFESQESSAVSSPQPETPEPAEARLQPTRYKPYQYPTGELKQTFKLFKRIEKQTPSTNSIGTQCNISNDLSTASIISPEDLRLFHHFTISTFRTMRHDDHDPQNLWQDHLPEWGIEFKPILHLILALSALHKGYKTPALREKYIAQADDHFTFGMRSVTSVLSQLDSENCQQIYMSAVMICFIYFGRGPRTGDYLVFSDQGPAEWIILMNGVKLIVTNHHEKIFSGLLEPKGERVKYELTPAMRSEFHDHSVHLQAVERFIGEQESDQVERDMYLSSTKGLFEIMDDVYEKVSGGLDGVMIMDLLIGWLYRRPDEFVHLLEQKDPLSLVILAYWAVLLRYMESSWFMQGWAAHVLSGISNSLKEEYWPWIQWPLRRVGNSN